ncbi:MBL fold metallo-hydrolase [Singulisphaera sp. PoT]|uniref:MBL fold metallo-hydrolase n=1 Tax=Singulisphaera sp. PoT TaxID=3411797 RepID=UPI003BF5B4F3
MASDLDTTVESLDHPVDNAPVRSLVHKGLTIEGYSRAAVQTYWRIPELKLGFDLGAQPWSFMSTPTWFVSHAHLDHLAALPVYVARRRMMKMTPPTIYLPADAIEGVEMLLRAFQRLDRGRLPAKLIPVQPDDEIELSRELVVKAFATKHTVPSLGFLVWERRKKLKREYSQLSGEEIRDLRLAGTEVSSEIRLPKVAYLGDTAPAGLDVLPEIYRAEILIMEMTFVAPGERASVIHKFGHTHLDDIIARADRFENEVIVASHFSTRLHPDQIQRIVDKRLPESLHGRLKVWL